MTTPHGAPTIGYRLLLLSTAVAIATLGRPVPSAAAALVVAVLSGEADRPLVRGWFRAVVDLLRAAPRADEDGRDAGG